MRKLVLTAITGLGLAASAVSLPAFAEEGSFAVGASAGTLGIGPELAWRFNDHLGLRANGGFFGHDQTDDIDDIRYDTRLKLDSVGVLLDVYPFGGGFRLSAGGRINSNEIDLAGTPTQNVEIGDVFFTPEEIGTLSGTLTTDKYVPTFTLGYGGKLAKGLTFSFELGVMIQGAPKIDNLHASGTLGNDPEFLEQLAIEEQKVEDDADDYKIWPVLQLGLLYRF